METNHWVQFVLRSYEAYPWVALLLIIMLLDYISGMFAGRMANKLSSKVGFAGMMKKAMLLIVLGVAMVVEQAIKTTLPAEFAKSIPIPLAKIVAGFFLLNEALSVLENAKRCGVPLPAFLTKGLANTMDRISNLGDNQETVTLEVENAHLEAKIVKTSSPAPVASPDASLDKQ